MPAKAFRIKRQDDHGETLHPPAYNACRACFQPIEDKKGVHYCGTKCQDAHQRLRGAA
jgi:hypothetical protein